MDAPTTQEQILFMGDNVELAKITQNDAHTHLIVVVKKDNITMKFKPDYYLLGLFSYYTQKASATADIYAGIKVLIHGKARLLTKLEEMVLQINEMPFYHNKNQDFSGVVRQFDGVIAVYNIDMQSNILKNQIATNVNVQKTNEHIISNNNTMKIILALTVVVAAVSAGADVFNIIKTDQYKAVSDKNQSLTKQLELSNKELQAQAAQIDSLNRALTDTTKNP